MTDTKLLFRNIKSYYGYVPHILKHKQYESYEKTKLTYWDEKYWKYTRCYLQHFTHSRRNTIYINVVKEAIQRSTEGRKKKKPDTIN